MNSNNLVSVNYVVEKTDKEIINFDLNGQIIQLPFITTLKHNETVNLKPNSTTHIDDLNLDIQIKY